MKKIEAIIRKTKFEDVEEEGWCESHYSDRASPSPSGTIVPHPDEAIYHTRMRQFTSSG